MTSADTSLDMQPRRVSTGRRPVDQMTPEELCAEALRLRGVISAAAEQLQNVYSTLYHRARRSTASETTYAYINLASSGRRLVGALLQGVRRASAFDRALEVAKQEAEDRAIREKEALAKQEARQAKKEAGKSKDKPQQAAEDPMGLYGPSEEEGFEPMIQQLLHGVQDSTSTSDDLDDLFGEDLG